MVKIQVVEVQGLFDWKVKVWGNKIESNNCFYNKLAGNRYG